MALESGAENTAVYLTHELRAPLTAIIAALHLLNDGETKGQDRALASLALANAQRLNRLIDDIMHSMTIHAGRMTMNLERCDPAVLAREATLALKPWADRDGIRLELRVEAHCPDVLADADRVKQALTNLISNALKFTPKGGLVEVVVEPGRRLCSDAVVVSVRDTGQGIPEDEQERIFDYFVQGRSGAVRAVGTGLGLPLARSMIGLMGGTMWVDSLPGRGATFKFTLPYSQG